MSLRALVLRQVDYRDSDRILTLLAEDGSRLDVKAPRARSSRKRFGGLDLFVLADVDVHTGRGAPRLNGATIERDFAGIRGDVVRLALASYAAELLAAAAQEGHEAADLFRLAVAAFGSLDVSGDDDRGGAGWARALELKLLHVLGVRPSLRACAACGERPVPPVHWSVAAGGVLSGDCRDGDRLARRIPEGVVALLDRALHLPLSDQAQVHWPRREAAEAASAMRGFVGQHVAVRERALRFLEQVLPLTLLEVALLAGCTQYEPPSEVRLQGYLFNTFDVPTDGDLPISLTVPDASGTAWSDGGELLVESATPFSDAPSWHRFSALSPNSSVQVVFDPPRIPVDEVEYVTTVLTGRTATEDLYVDPGAFVLWPRATVDAWVTAWFDEVPGALMDPPTFDPELPGEGGMAVGRVADAAEFEGYRLIFRDPAGFDREAWYTDEDGDAIEGDALSAEGGFAVFGLGAGPIEVIVRRPDDTVLERTFTTRFQEDGVTSLFGFTIVD